MAEYVIIYDTAKGDFSHKQIGAQHILSGAVVSGGVALSGNVGSGQLASPHFRPAGITSSSFGSGQIGWSHILGLNLVVGGTWTAASAWTIPAVTLGGTVTGGSQNIIGLGTVLIGASTAYGRVSQALEVNTSIDYGGIALNTWAGSGNAPILDFNKSRSVTTGTYTVVVSGDVLGIIAFRGADGTNWQGASHIEVDVTGTVATDRVPGLMKFFLYSDAVPSVATTVLTLTAAGINCNNIPMSNVTMSGTWLASGTVTLPAVTLGGTVTGGNQNINSLGHIGLGNNASNANIGIYYSENQPVNGTPLTGLYVKAGYISASGSSADYIGVYAWAQFGDATTAAGCGGTISAFQASAHYSNVPPGGWAARICLFDGIFWGTDNGATLTNAYGLYIPANFGGTYTTNAYGIYIGAITATTLAYAIYSLGGLSLLTGGIQGLMTSAVTAANQTINAVPTASVLTAANAASFTGTAQHLVLPSITPAANGAGITLTGLALSQGAISNVADTEAITVNSIVITGAAGAALVTGVYTWTGINITTPAQAANAAINLGTGIKITCGATAGAATAYQRGIDITMAAATDTAAYLAGIVKIDVTSYNPLLLNSSAVAHGMTGLVNSTNTYFQGGMSSLTAGGATFFGCTDADGSALNFYGVIGVTNPADSTPAIMFVGGKYNGVTGWQALGAAETVIRFGNYSTTLLDILGNGQLVFTTVAGLTLAANLPITGDYILQPNTDGEVSLGQASNRFKLMRAITITSGDFSFENGYRLTEAEKFGQKGIALVRPDGTLAQVFN